MSKSVKDGRRRDPRNPSPMDFHVGKRLRARRSILGLTQADVARLARMSHQQIQKYESGKDRIPAGRLFELAGLLGVDINWFFDGFDGASQSGPALTRTEPDVVKLIGAYNRISNDADKVSVQKLATSLAARRDEKR
jgi:transcriptional regulator with XRE-family HTH domain